MKKLLRTLKRRLAGRFLPQLIYLAMRGLYATMRVRIIGGEIPQAFHDRGEGTVTVSWHGRLLLTPFSYKGNGVYCLISIHGDGEIIANVMNCFGIGMVRGSSSKGGKKALLEMVRLGRKNYDLAVTPDGPRGPAEIVKPGAAQLARLTGNPVIPLAFSCSRGKRFASWDRFMVPYPFSRAVIVWGEPLYARQDEEPEALRLRIEQALRETTARADKYFSS